MFFSILCNGIQEATTSRVNSSINYRLWVILTRHCRLISRKKWTLVGDGDNGGGDHACVGQAVYTAKSHLNVAVNPKTAQKSKVLIIKKKKKFQDKNKREIHIEIKFKSYFLGTEITTKLLKLRMTIKKQITVNSGEMKLGMKESYQV